MRLLGYAPDWHRREVEDVRAGANPTYAAATWPEQRCQQWSFGWVCNGCEHFGDKRILCSPVVLHRLPIKSALEAVILRHQLGIPLQGINEQMEIVVWPIDSGE